MKRLFLTGLMSLTLTFPCLAHQNSKSSSPLGERVVEFARARVGQKVGDGECWTLADRALQAAGAKRPGRDGRGPFVFGRRLRPGEPLRPGDILQFKNVRLEHKEKSGGSSWVELGQHTAIVARAEGDQVTIYQQNTGTTPKQKLVRQDTINLADRVRGTVTAFRPLPR